MHELRGPALLAMVTTLTSLGFLMIGFDNGLLGGVGVYKPFTWYKIIEPPDHQDLSSERRCVQ